MFILKKKIPGWHIDWETSKLSLKVKLFQVLLRRHLPALLETEINRSKFTKKGKISGQHRQMKRAIKFFFFYIFENWRLGAQRSAIFPLGRTII